MTLNAVFSLQLEIGLLNLFKQGGVILGSTVVNRGDVGDGPHRLKLLGVLLLINILRLVYLQKQMGCVTDDADLFICGEEDGSGITQTDDITKFSHPDAAKTDLIQSVFESHH